MQSVPQPEEEGSQGPEPAPVSRSGRNLPVAIATGLFLAGLIFATLFVDVLLWTLLVAAAILIALAEFYKTLATARGLKPASVLGYSAALVLLFGTAWRGIGTLSFALVAVAIMTFLWYLVDPDRDRVSDNMAATLLGVVYIPLFAAHVVAMAKLEHGPALTIAFLGAVVFYDVGAYAAGSFFGKHRIAPRISPSKTWEGAAGATMFVLAVAASAGPFFPGLELRSALGLGAIVVLLAPLGDLAESLLKRDLGVKDMGGVLPGHGGMLDRIDALLFVAPFAYWFLAATR